MNWVPLMGYEGLYEITRCGLIRSLSRNVRTSGGWTQRHNGSRIKSRPKNNGYLVVDLSSSGKKRTHHLHRLLATQFIPNPNGKKCINHIDCDKQNNAIENLEWCTHSENWHHAKRHGKIPPCPIGPGEQSRAAKLSEADVREIKKRLLNGEPERRVALDYGVVSATIGHIKHGRTWGHVSV